MNWNKEAMPGSGFKKPQNKEFYTSTVSNYNFGDTI